MDPLKKRKLEENGVVLADLAIEDAKKILEPLTHEQLFAIVQNAVIRHQDVLDAVRVIADGDASQRKLFIRGLGWETNTEKLRALFGQYGELDEAVVILDKATGKSKGYGFITFKHIDGALRALKQPSKQIDGRMTVTQLAAAGVSGGGTGAGAGGGGGGGSSQVDLSLRKIYVANVPYDMTGERLLQHFAMYGEIEEGPLGFDKATGKSKGFALFVYRTPEAARASLVDPVKNIDGHQLNCKLANDGKKGKPGPGGVQGGATGQGNGVGSGMPVGGQYGGPGGMGGMSNCAGYSGVNPVGGNLLVSTVGSGFGGANAGAISVGGTGSALGGSGGFGSGPYGSGSHFGGPVSTGYGGLGGTGGGVGGTGGGVGGAGRGLGGAGGGLGSAGGGLGGAGGGLGGAGGGLSGAGGGLGGAGGGLGGAGGGLGGAGGGLGGAGAGLGGGLGSAGSGFGGPGSGLGSAGSGFGGPGSGLGGRMGSGGSGYGGPGSGFGGVGAGSGLSGAGAALSGVGSGLGGAGRGSSLYGLGPASAGMRSGEYPHSAHYSLSASSSAHQNLHHQATGASPAPRVPPGGMYQGPPYY